MSTPTAPKLREQDRKTYEVSRRWPLVSGSIALALVLIGGVLIALRQFAVVPYSIDSAWMDELYENRTPALENVAYFFDWMGGGIVGVFVVPIALAIVLIAMKRKWGAVYFISACVVSAGLVQLVKNLVERPRPEQILVHADFGSFPSGHTANAATLAVVLGFIGRRWWVWAIGALWVIGMLLSRNYLGAHWLTDTLGGLVLGAAVALILWAPFAHRLHRETLAKRDIEPVAGVPAS
ncbi:phosphatase PAP2 family protein [Amnibacterium flavum]|uniref:Phosphoesterase PA-phosphatase n=1 Tax=Amnibacterium flavum TaxID=2173173 RepID=A0A2V1HW27_9MICO|nr:phosphatase PAP2 family protein [Amnibacterium flavum]PVZ94627.1 phosphoesterase PA-phosphatase [Amnibacterium flavum]